MKRLARIVTVVLWILGTLVLWQALEFVSDNNLRKYTSTGDAILLALWCLFALGAWWYAEDRDRRRAAKAATSDEHASPDGDGR